MVGVLLWASNSFPSIFLGWKYEKENFKKICRARSFFSGVLPIGMYTLLTMYLTANFLIYESWIQESYFFFCVKLITHVWFMMWRELCNWNFQLQFSNYRELAPFHPKGPHHLAKKKTNTKCCHLAIKRKGIHGSDGTMSSNQHGSVRRVQCCQLAGIYPGFRVFLVATGEMPGFDQNRVFSGNFAE